MSDMSQNEEKVTEIVQKCHLIKNEIDEVLAELDAPKVSDSPDDCGFDKK